MNTTPSLATAGGVLADLELVWNSVSDGKDERAAYERIKQAIRTVEAMAGALQFLLPRIGSWTNARWDQHLRYEFGDERAGPMIAALDAFGSAAPAGGVVDDLRAMSALMGEAPTAYYYQHPDGRQRGPFMLPRPGDGNLESCGFEVVFLYTRATPAGDGDEYRRGYEEGVRAVKASPYYDASADTKPATPAGDGELDERDGDGIGMGFRPDCFAEVVTPARDGDWWCDTCANTVEPSAVTHDERHDARNGGCGMPVSQRYPFSATPAGHTMDKDGSIVPGSVYEGVEYDNTPLATPAGDGEAVGYECRVIHTDGSFGTWRACSREQYDSIRLTGHYNGPGGAMCEARALYTTPRIPDGMVLVPREPTPEMIAAYTALDYSDLIEFNYYDGMTGWDLTVTQEGARNAWKAMLTAAPREE